MPVKTVKYLQTDGMFGQLEDSDESGNTKSLLLNYGRNLISIMNVLLFHGTN